MSVNISEKFTLASFNCFFVTRSINDIQNLCSMSDVVALQETCLLPHDIPLLGNICSDFEYTGKSAVDTSVGLLKGRPYGGVAILWRKGIFDSVTVLDCDSARVIGIRATMGERTVIFFSVYMPTDSLDNLPIFTEVLGELSAIVESENVESIFILGDFNAHPHELFYNELTNFCSDQSWICADIEKLGLQSNVYTYISAAHGCRRWLDHCVVSSSAWQSVVEVEVIEDVFVSDHLPLIVKCDLRIVRPKLMARDLYPSSVIWGERDQNQISEYQKLCHNRLREIDFPSEFVGCSRGLCGLDEHRRVLDQLYDSIVQALSDAASKTKKKPCNKPSKNKHLCGWNKHVQEAHRVARLNFGVWLSYNRPSSGRIYDQMNESRKIFKSRLKWCQRNQEQLKMDILAKHRVDKNFKQFWKATKRHDVRPGLPVSVGGENESVHIANSFAQHFKVYSPLGPRSVSVNTGSVQAGCQKDVPLVRVTAKQVREALKRMTGGKSPGHDGISVEHLRHAGSHLPRVLALFFSMCINHSYLPQDLIKTIVVPIVKDRTGDISNRGNYRPISLATTIAKVLDSVFDSELDKYANIHDAQFGFRPGLSTESAILSLKHTVQYYTDRKTPVYACFLDLSKAFDLVSYEVLWRGLAGRGVPAELLEMFRFWYSNQTNFVRWADSLSGAYVLECGVRQGGLTSPKLFNIYMNDLIVELSSMRVGCRIDGVSINNISYADDMVLLSPTVGGLREMLKVCETYATERGLTYNVKKTEYMVFEAAGKCHNIAVNITLNGLSVKRVTNFKYLGHIITGDLKDDADIERERRALAVRGNMLARRFSRCTKQVKVTLFKAYCQSIYTGSLWVKYTRRSLDTLRIQYNNIFRMLLGLPRFCSASGMFAAYQTDGFNAIIRKKSASLISRVRASDNSILKTIADRYTSPLWKCLVQRLITGPYPPP
ncbi:hypothetical protein ABMA27_001826 [Loxostege sticticalis]|uniref:Reverse transcriptase domain-containing protein n=1 Tax=Loxostege sticticalis TaxID=481309 RepID=A0ABR3HVK1_LOXSC